MKESEQVHGWHVPKPKDNPPAAIATHADLPAAARVEHLGREGGVHLEIHLPPFPQVPFAAGQGYARAP